MWGVRTAFIGALCFLGAAQAQESTIVKNSTADNDPGQESPDNVKNDNAQNIDDGKTLFRRDSYKLTPVICPFKGEVDYKADHLSCRLLEVPENREKSRGRKIELHVIKLHARKPDNWDAEEKGAWKKRDDPIIYLTGGPGAKAINYVARFQNHGARDVRDLYILEQRGIGFSADFCPLYQGRNPMLANADSREKAEDAALAAMEDCFIKAKAAGVDLSGYSTIENARDVKALRRALEIEQWNVWGISYGSILGQAYLKEDPQGVRAAVIDAIVPLYPGTTLHNTTKYYVRDLDILAKACNADENCAKHFSNFRKRLKTGVKNVAARPIIIETLDKETSPSGKTWIFENLIGAMPFGLLYEQDNYAALPAFIDAWMNAVEKRDPETFRILSAGGGPVAGFSQGMFNAIACRDGWTDFSAQASMQDIEAYPIMSKTVTGTLTSPPRLIEKHKRICKRYGAAPRPREDYAPLETDLPTLLVEGAMDPITPPPLAKEILPGFRNGTYVEFAFAGHGPSRSVKCAGEFLTKFYDNPDGPLDQSCPDSMTAPAFIGPLLETSAFARLGVLAAADKEKLALPALWLGASALFLLIGAMVYNIAPVARLINGNRALPTSGARILAWAVCLAGVSAIAGLGFAIYATSEAGQFLFLVGLVGWARWFALIGLLAGFGGLVLLGLTVRARLREILPIGVLLGLFLSAAGGLGLAGSLIFWGILPF